MSHTAYPITNSNNNITTTATSSSIINSVSNSMPVSTTPNISTTPSTNILSDVKFSSNQPTITFNSISPQTNYFPNFSKDPTITPPTNSENVESPNTSIQMIPTNLNPFSNSLNPSSISRTNPQIQNYPTSNAYTSTNPTNFSSTSHTHSTFSNSPLNLITSTPLPHQTTKNHPKLDPTNKLSTTIPPTNNLSNIEPTKDISTTIPPPNLEPSTNISTTLGKASKKLKKVSKPVTDTCWNWVVLVACTFSTTIMGSSYILFSLIYSNFLNSFEASTSYAGWVGSIHVGCVNLFGIPCAFLIDRFGCRVITVFGTLLCSLGFVLSAFATSITYLIITYGVMSGCGLGMIFLSSAIISMQNFDKKRPIAGAIFSFGYNIGSVGIGPVLNIVFDHYSWRGCLIIYAGFVLQMVVAATLTFKPQQYVDVWEPCDDDDEEDDEIKGIKVDTLKPLMDSKKVKINHTNFPIKPSSSSKLSILRKNLSNFTMLLKVKKDQYKSLLTDRPLVIYLFATFWMYMGIQSFVQHMPNRALKLGIDRKMVSYLPTSNNGIAGITKIIAGLIANLPGVNRCLLYSFAMLGTGLSQCLIPLCHSFNTLFMQGLLEGAFIGCIFSAIFVILVDLKGIENFTTTQPLLTMTSGLGALFSTPLTGFIYDKTDDYDITFLITSGIILLGTFFSFVSVAMVHKRDKKMAKDNVKKVPRKTSGFVSLSSLN